MPVLDHRNQYRRPGAIAIAIVLQCAAMTRPPIRLMLPDAGQARDASWVVTLSQSIEVDANGHIVPAGRTWSAGFRVADAADTIGGVVRATFVVDSVRAASIVHDARQPIDTRRIRGAALEAKWQRTDGAVSYVDAPTVDFGDLLGGEFPVSLLIDNVLPPMPAQIVDRGQSWERTWKRSTIVGTTIVEQARTVQFTLERVERERREEIARIRVSTADEDLSGFLRVGVRDGVVREAELLENGSGSINLGGTSYPFRQQMSIRVGPAVAPTEAGARELRP